MSSPSRFKKLSPPFTLMMIFAILAVFFPTLTAIAIACAAIFVSGVILLAAEHVVSNLKREELGSDQDSGAEE